MTYDAKYQRAYYLTHKDALDEYQRAYRAAHVDEARDYNRHYRKTHTEDIAAYLVEHRDTIKNQRHTCYEKNRDSRKAYSRAYRLAHRDQISETNHIRNLARREYYARYHRAYLDTERGRAIAYACCRRRRASKRGAVGADYTTAEMIEARCSLWGNRCWICGGPMQAIDHVKPLAKGGAHLPCNLRPICKPCNSRKGAKWPHEPVTKGERNV
jgi:5-methylcytosine-specific restriction endonuclease McrA